MLNSAKFNIFLRFNQNYCFEAKSGVKAIFIKGEIFFPGRYLRISPSLIPGYIHYYKILNAFSL